MNRFLHFSIALVLSAVATQTRAQSPVAVPVDGKPFAARLVGVDAAWQLTFEADGNQRKLPAAHLARWGTCAEPVRGPILVLADGGIVRADVASADKENLVAESDLLGTLKLPLESLAGVAFHLPAARHDRDLLIDRIARATGETDRVLLDNGDEVSGLIETIAGTKVRVKAELGPLDIESRRIVALIFNPALRRKADVQGLVAWVGLSDGGRILASRLVTREASVELTTPQGHNWKTARNELVFLQPLGNRAVYLSDLKPSEVRLLPYLDLPWPYHGDRNVTGGMLRCGRRLYLKGLGVHSTTRLAYALDPSYKRFQAELGIDDSTGGRGSVGFRIFVDGKQRYASDPIRGGAAPTSVSIDLTDARQLDLVVDYGERGDMLDHADWLDARLVR